MNRLKSTLANCWLIVCLMMTVSAQAEVDPMSTMEDLAQAIKAGTGGRVNLSGYINGHYMKHDGMPKFVGKNLNKSLVQLREASFFADILITDYLIFSTELELSYDFSEEDSSGREDSFEGLLNYFYLDYQISDHLDWDEDESGTLKFRIGRILVPFLSYNENKPNFEQTLMSQPFTAWQMVPVNNVAVSFKQFGWTDIGLSGNWSKALGDHGLLDIKLSVINGLGSDVNVLDSNTVQIASPMSTGIGGMGASVMPTVRPRDGLANAKSDWDEFSDVNSDKATVLKVSYASFSVPLEVGVSWYQGAWDEEEEHDLTMVGVHLNYTQKDWSVKTEWVRADVEQTADINIVTAMGPSQINISTGDYNMQAWSIEGAYTSHRYGPGNDRFLTWIVRLDNIETNDEATFSPFNRSRSTIGLELGFLHNVRLRLEYQRHSLDDYDAAPGPYVSAGGDEDISMGMLSVIAYF